MKLRAYAPLLRRTGIFILLFAVLSSWIGLRIINGDLLYRYHFNVYGSMGKACVFALLTFGLLVGSRLRSVRIRSWGIQDVCWLVGSLAAFICAYVGVVRLDASEGSGLLALMTHLVLLAFVALLAVGCFGLETLRQIFRSYKRELMVAAALAVAFELFIFIVYGLWRYLSSIAMYATHATLGLVGLHSEIILPHTLVFDRFAIEIGQYCSGIESIALFTGLYVVIGIVDWSRFNHRRFLLAFAPGLLLLFACNILRINLLIMLGYFINPQIAFTLFHTYAGMVLFVIYSAIFWFVTYRWMLHADHTCSQ